MMEAAFASKCEERGLDRDELLPPVWYMCKEYHKKVEILCEALDKGVMVQDLPEYQELFSENKRETGSSD